MRPEGREPLPDKAGESTLPSRSGGEKGLRGVEYSYSDFLQLVEDKTIKEACILDKSTITGRFLAENGQLQSYVVEIPYEDSTLIENLIKNDVLFYGKTSKPSVFSKILSYLPWLITVFLLFSILKQNSMANAKGMKFGESRALHFV